MQMQMIINNKIDLIATARSVKSYQPTLNGDILRKIRVQTSHGEHGLPSRAPGFGFLGAMQRVILPQSRRTTVPPP